MLRRYLVAAVMIFAATTQMMGQSGNTDAINELHAEMLRLFETDDSLDFRDVVIQLKVEAERQGNEGLFYKAWTYQVLYQSLHNRLTKAMETVKLIKAFAEDRDSKMGQYAALHSMGSVYHQMRDYDKAEETYKKAIDYLHKNLPDMSAAANYIELIILSRDARGDVDQALAYAVLALDDPNITAYQRMRVITMLCQMEGEKENPDKKMFNKYYEDRLQAVQGTVPDKTDRYITMLYYYVNGQFERALGLCDSLNSAEERTYAKALVFHKMGDDAKAFRMMVENRSVRDSLKNTQLSGLLKEYITQINTERQELEQHELRKKNAQLVAVITAVVISVFIALLCWIIYKRVKLTKQLNTRNAELDMQNAKERAERQKTQEELDMKREFMNVIAKELRSPLNPITGFSDILTSDVELRADEREIMRDHIKENSEVLIGIIDNMLELTFYESKTSLPHNEEFSPNLVCQNAIDHMNEIYHKENVELTFKTELDPKFRVKSDMMAVGKVLRHLLDNAIKFTDQGGVLLSCSKKDNNVVFIVSDTGCGIEPEWRKHIFQPMMNSGGVVRSKGMGLAICALITKLLDGKLWLDEKTKKGSRFVFEIPITNHVVGAE